MLFLTDTWQTPNDYMHLNVLTPNEHQHLSKPRSSGKGSVVLRLYIVTQYYLLDWSFTTLKTFEYMVLKLVSHRPLIIIFIYKPTKQVEFFSELSEL